MKKTGVTAAGLSGAFVLPEWPARETIGALTTTRQGGHSPGPYGGFNLALHVGDDPEAVLANRWNPASDYPDRRAGSTRYTAPGSSMPPTQAPISRPTGRGPRSPVWPVWS